MSVARRPNIDPERLAVLWLGFDQGMTLFTITLKRPDDFHLALLFKRSAFDGHAVRKAA